jgi:hypothetical protein
VGCEMEKQKFKKKKCIYKNLPPDNDRMRQNSRLRKEKQKRSNKGYINARKSRYFRAVSTWKLSFGKSKDLTFLKFAN